MARRRRGVVAKAAILVILALAGVGAWTIWRSRPIRDGIDAAGRAAEQAGRAAKEARRAWR